MQTIDLLLLKEKGFIKEDNGRSILTLDITMVVNNNRSKMVIDANANVINSEV